MLNDNKSILGYVNQTVLPTAAAAYTLYNPIVAIRTAVPGIVASWTLDKVVNTGTKALTGKTVPGMTTPYIGHSLSEMATPGNLYGSKVAYNFNNLGRFVMDNVFPASYGSHGMDFAKVYAKAFFQAYRGARIQQLVCQPNKERRGLSWWKRPKVDAWI